MNNGFLNTLLKVKYYALTCLLLLGLFVWAQLSGTRLLGDDTESVENINGQRQGGRSHGGRSYFYHK